MSFPEVLFLTSNDGTQQGRSGYDVLVDYFPSAKIRVVRRRREHPQGILARLRRRLSSRGAASTWFMLSSAELERMARTAIRERRPEIVHHLWGNRDWGFLHRPLAAAGIPFVVTLHNVPSNMAEIFPRPECFETVAAVVLMSSDQRAPLEAMGVPGEKLHVVHHGIDVEYFRPLEERPRGGAEGPFTVLSVGHTRRNFPLLERLIRSLEDDPGVEFRVVSKPAFRERFESFRNVRFESGLSNEELRLAYQEAGVQILTAEEATANNALLEGLACGLPIVGEAVGGIPEYCGSEAAVLTAPNDADALREGILRLREDVQERRRRADAARARALELRWEVSARQLGERYRGLVSQPA